MPRRAALVVGLFALLGCDDKKPDPSAERAAPSAAASSMATLFADAGGLGEQTDPPAPAGDLKMDLDRFVNVETCVAERAKLDPLVGDALRAIGYDTFLRDACRLLEATKERKRETCDRIDSSALRARCQSWVAMVAETPDACPLQFESAPTRGRNASCIAIAAKDPRLCTGEPRAVPRATCEAMTTRNEAKCDALLPGDRSNCKRELARWRTLLATPLEGLPALAPSRGKLTIHGADGTPDPKTTEVDLAADYARGAVVVTSRDRARVEFGTVGESEAARIAPSPQRNPRVGVAIVVELPRDGRAKDAPKVTLQKLELEIPGEATIVHPDARCDCKVTTAHVDPTRGGAISVALEGTVGLGSRAYRITIDLGTFTRDVVAEQLGQGPRVLPPLHPTLTRDGG